MSKTFVIDLFCGAGGTTTAIHQSNTNMEVIACINHDPNAILSHKQNYPNCLHFTEDIRTINLSPIRKLVNKLRSTNPDCKIALWASLECTNYSKAKGGLPRDPDSRSLADHLFRYIDSFLPDFVWIENVREFMSWGPLNKKGRPISRDQGKDYLRWTEKVKSYGYHFDWRLLNSADYGAYTSRTRYFAQFSTDQSLISWPDPTHEKKPKKNMLFGSPKKQWKAVKEVLDLNDEGKSIFARKKPLSENTLKRIYAGLEKFVANGEPRFIKKYFSGKPMGKVISVNGPAGTVTTVPQQAVVKAIFLGCYYSGGGQLGSIEEPSPTVTTKDRISKINCDFLVHYQNLIPNSVEEPCPPVLTKDKYAKTNVQFFTHYYSGGGQLSSIENPHPCVLNIPKSRLTSINFVDNQYGNSLPNGIDRPLSTITQNPKQALVSAHPWIYNPNFNNIGNSIDEPSPTLLASRKHYYLITPNFWLLNKNSSTAFGKSINDPSPTTTQRTHYLMHHQFGHKGSSIDNPCFTLIARMDKKPPYLISAECELEAGIIVYESDSEMTVKIKEFMAAYGIVDIKMRMLKVCELLPIQGFPADYKLVGTQTEKKKYIGNSVEVNVGKALFEAIESKINQMKAA